ncbi:MAG: lysylphosphatidylglycerol synthase transmembrane domain-containing protein [Desulfobacterales bacterium]|nr:lysylphosphatidylglycerol synthase transmembrane domain-containing protein [Desulfobacterales bacterium]
MQRKILFSLVLGGLVSLAGFYLAFRHVPLKNLVAYAGSVDPLWVLPTFIALVCIFYLRALRWQLLLRPIGRVPLAMAYHTLVISLMLNCILPGRMGEVARPVILWKKGGLNMASSLATLAAERLLDLAALLTLLVLALPGVSLSSAHPVVFGTYELSGDLLMRLAQTSALALAAMVVGLLLVALDGMRTRIVGLIRLMAHGARRLTPQSHHHRIETAEKGIIGLLARFAEGLQSLKSPGRLFGFAMFSLLIWLLVALSFYLVACGSPGIDLTFADTLVMMVVICLFIALPSVPGYWGLWEAAGVFALYMFGITGEPAAGFTLVNHAVQILPLIPAGWISCLLLGLGWSDIKARRITRELPDAGS